MSLKDKLLEKGPDLVNGGLSAYYVVNGSTPASKRTAGIQLIRALSNIFSFKKKA